MNADRLLRHYERIADAADAIPRIRGFILQLAVRGKLVPQNRQDTPASDLLKSVKVERARLVTAGVLKKDREATVIGDDEAPFGAPSQWVFVRLGTVLEMFNGRAFKPTEWTTRGLPIVRIQNLNNPKAAFNLCDATTVDERHLVRDNDFLISWSGTPGTSFGAFIWKRGNAALNQHIFRCMQVGAAFDPEFLRLAINSQLDVLIAQAQGGVGLQHVTKGTLESLPLPLPPVAEQRRIVTKVDELMALCNQLEAARADRETKRNRLTVASLARINAPDPDTFQHDTRFALNALPALTAHPNQIKQLRETILNLAVHGHLVPHNPRDEPASELMKRIAAAKPPSLRASVTFENDGDLYALPVSWDWAALNDLITSGPQNGVSPRPTTRHDAPMAITLTATTSGVFNPAYFKRVEANIPSDSEYWLREGDLLFQRGNTREYVGIAAIYVGPERTFLFPDLIMKVRVSPLIDLRFVHMAANSPPARAYLSANASGAQATMPKINQTTLVSLPIPLPPVAEQRRIVTKVDELMALCDRLEASLNNGADTRRRLLDALIAKALVPVDSGEIEEVT